MTSGVGFGVAVMLLWGAADMLQTLAIRRIGAPTTMLARGALASVIGALLCAVLAWGGLLRLSVAAMGAISAAAAAYALGYAAYMRGMEIGAVSLVAPVASAFAVVTVALAALLGETALGLETSAAIALVVLGVLLLSGLTFSAASLRGAAGLREALTAMLLFGGTFFILARAPDAPALPALFAFSTLTRGLCFMATGAALGGRVAAAREGGRRVLRLMLGHAALLHAGWLSYIAGAQLADIAVVAPLASAFAGVTTLLAALLLRERLGPAQWAGLALILTGVALLNG